MDSIGWIANNYANTFDYEQRPDNCERIDINRTSPKEFIEKYEMKYRPVVITGITDNWKTKEKWTLEVRLFYIHL